MIEDNGYIYLYGWLILMVNVGKCTSFMDSMGITLIPFFSFKTLTSMDIYQIQSHKGYIDSHMSKEICIPMRYSSYPGWIWSYISTLKSSREVVIKFTQTRIFCERNPDQTKRGPTVDGWNPAPGIYKTH